MLCCRSASRLTHSVQPSSCSQIERHTPIPTPHFPQGPSFRPLKHTKYSITRLMATFFNIKCTLPPPATTFVRPPDARGTLDIVYSCLTIIILCTWSILPLNVPTQIESRPGKQTHLRGVRRLQTKLKWMAINVLGPEWPLITAINGLESVKKLEKKFEMYKGIDDVPWTSSHTHLENMGGFMISFGDEAKNTAVHADHEELARPQWCISGDYCERTHLNPSNRTIR